jgi:prepilin-type N-terminal cleavage/methylation domain-containing protein
MQHIPFPNHSAKLSVRRAFTLTELMIVMTIIAIMTGLGFAAYTGAIELSREQRTGAMINKIDQLIGERYEGYRTRAVPIKIPVGTSPRLTAMIRLNALRDLMRMELPDRISDVFDPPCDVHPGTDPSTNTPLTLIMTSPALQSSYIRRAKRILGSNYPGGWSVANQGAECLYLILSTMRDGDKSALDYFASDEIGDTDGDGMSEILDGWGTPIQFVRWPAGYAEQLGADGSWGKVGIDDDGNGTIDDIWEAGWPFTDDTLPDNNYMASVPTMQTKNYLKAPDPFDPVKVHAGSASPGPITLFGTAYTPGYALFPLIVSAGPDKTYDIVIDSSAGGFHYSPAPAANNYPNPYVLVAVTMAGNTLTVPMGTPGDVDGDSIAGYNDNITNHSLRSQQK